MSERDPRSLKGLVAGVFDRAATSYDTVAGSYFSVLGPRLVDKIHVVQGSTVVDVACGKGATSIPCADRVGTGGTVLGVDISSEMTRSALTNARSRGLDNVIVSVMDGERLALQDACADVVVCAFSLHFLPNPSEAAAEFARVLRPGGTIALSEWGPDDDRWEWEGELIGNLPVGSVSSGSFDTPEALQSFLAAAGATDIDITTESITVRLADEEEWWAWKWSYSFRYVLEQLEADDLDRFKAEAQKRVRAMREPGGIPLDLHALMAVGHK